MGTPKALDKQRLLDEMDEQLTEMKVDPVERKKINRSYARFIAFDFYQMYTRAIDYAINRRMVALSAPLGTGGGRVGEASRSNCGPL